MMDSRPPVKKFIRTPERREQIESFWFLIIVILGFIALIAMSISKALKPI